MQNLTLLRKKTHKLLLFFALNLFNLIAYSLPEDREQLLGLFALKANLNQLKHSWDFNGQVKLDQGTTHLRADKAITHNNQKNQIILAIAYAEQKKSATSLQNLVHYWTRTSCDKPLLHAFAKVIRYYPEKNIVELLGQARVIQGENSIMANKIVYNTLTQHVISQGNGKKRSVIIFEPEKKA